MLRPSVRRQTRKLKQNVKKSVQLSKNKVVTTSGISQNRKEVLKHQILKPKLNISVHSSRVQKTPDKLNAVSGYRKATKRHSQSKSTIKSFIPQSDRKSKSMRLSEGKPSFNLGNDARRVTRSSFQSVHNTLSEKRIQKARQNKAKSKRNIKKSSVTLNDSVQSNVTNSILLNSRSTEKAVIVKQTAIEKQPVITGEPKRVTRSSIGSVTGSSLSRKRSLKSRLITEPIHRSPKKRIKSKQVTRSRIGSETGSISSVLQSSEKRIKSKPTVKKQDSGGQTEVSKRVTRSSLGSATSSSSIRNKNSVHKLLTSPPIQSSGKQVVNKKETVAAKNSKKMTRSSLSNANNTSISLRNKASIDTLVAPAPQLEGHAKMQVKRSIDTLVAPPLQLEGHAKKRVKTKRTAKEKNVLPVLLKDIAVSNKSKKLRHSDLRDVSGSSLLTEDTISKLVDSPLPQSAPKTGRYRQTPEDTGIGKKVSKRKTCSRLCDLVAILEPADGKIKKAESKKSKESDISTNTRRKTLSETTKSTPVASISGTRRKSDLSHSGSSAKGKRNSGEKQKSKGVKRNTKVSPRIEGKRKREASPNVPASIEHPAWSIDCLTDALFSKRQRRHTVDVPLERKARKPLSTTQQKLGKKSSIRSLKQTKGTPKAASLSSCSTPNTSILPVDCISTFVNKRHNSAPAAIKRPKLVKGLNSSIPKKGTLKRKRWMLNALKEKNEGYADDIFENRKFATPFRIPTELGDESDTSIATPKFGFLLTPALPKKTPKYKEIISPSDLLLARKGAEEYLFRRQNRKRASNNITLKTPSSAQPSTSANFDPLPEKKKLEFAEAMDRIQAIQNDIRKQTQDGEDEDDYFNDVLA